MKLKARERVQMPAARGTRRSTRIKDEQPNLDGKCLETALLTPSLEEFKGCTWKKSEWIKLYCECFLNNKHWSTYWTWNNCFNMSENDEELEKIRRKITSRNPLAFIDKLKPLDEDEGEDEPPTPQNSSQKKVKHVRGCNCRKSQCGNNYCECFHLGVGCTELCKCTDCQNSHS